MYIGLEQANVFMLVMVRMTGMFILAPVFGNAHIPTRVKTGFAAVTAVVVTPIQMQRAVGISPDLLTLVGIVIKELLVGAVIGYVALLVFAGVQLAGQVVDMQIGFGMANIVDPAAGTQVTVLGQFKFLIATLAFLAVNGHHHILIAVARSYDIVPLAGVGLSRDLFYLVTQEYAKVFSIAVRLALPVTAAVMIGEAALGVMARAVPHMNVLMVGFPLKIATGIMALAVVMPGFISYLGAQFSVLSRNILLVLRAFAPN